MSPDLDCSLSLENVQRLGLPRKQTASNFIDFLNTENIPFRDAYYVKGTVVFLPGMKSHVGVEAKLHTFFILALGGGDGHLQLWLLYSRGYIARYPMNNRMGEAQILSSPFTEEKKTPSLCPE
jgi:hypothetical protein